MNRHSAEKLGFIYIMIALFLWGIHGPAGRFLALRGNDMYFVATTRVWMGAGVFFLFLLYKKALRFDYLAKWKMLLFLSFTGLFLNTLTYHLALNYISGTLLMILENLAPVFVFMFSFFLLNIKPGIRQILSLLLSFCGIFLIIAGKDAFSVGGSNPMPGIIWGILAGLTFAFNVFFSSEMVKPIAHDPVQIIQYLFRLFLVSGILMLPFLFLHGKTPDRPDELFWLIEMGIFQSGLAYLFWNYALRYISANSASILFLLTILFTTVNELLFLDLQLNIYLVLGGLLIIASGRMVTKS